GSAPDGATDPTPATDKVTVDLLAAPELSVVKTAESVVDTDVPADGAGDAGDTITYSYAIENTGNVTLSGITVSDDRLLDADIVCPDTADNTIAELAPGDDATCQAVYVISDADVVAGEITNVVLVEATPPGGEPSSTTASDSLTVTVDGGPIAVDDSTTIPMGAIARVPVLNNDAGGTLTVTSVTQPSAGTATHDGTTVTVTPPVDFVGEITLSYTISNGSRSATALVTVVVTPSDVSPAVLLFIDLDGDGVRTADELPIPGVEVEFALTARLAYGSGATSLIRIASITTSCTTGADGSCRVSRVPVGEYSIRPVTDLGGAGLSVTADPDGDLDLETSVVLGPVVSPVNGLAVVASMPSIPMAIDVFDASEFGLRGTAALAGTAFIERGGGSGFQSSSDEVLPGQVLLVTWAGLDGVLGTDDDVEFPATADESGEYTAGGLPTGSYSVRLDPASLSLGASPSEPTIVEATSGATAQADAFLSEPETTPSPPPATPPAPPP
ncbi:MAG: DUF7507 domain-containing protein, partial [Ilumatobacteraceae bacterium]